MLVSTPAPPEKGLLMNGIVSAVSGRIRLRAPDFERERLDALVATLAGLQGVSEVSCRPRIASVLIRYDPRALSRCKIEARVRALLDGATASPDDDPDPDDTVLGPAPALPRREWRRVVNRYAKYGAMAAMTLALLAIAARRKGLHTQAGLLTLAFTGLHMYIHRRNLLR